MEGEKQFSVYVPGLETEGSKLAAQKAMHSQYVLQLLQLQRQAGFLCDITINIEDKAFKAHKPLLAACSLYFRALFADSSGVKTSSLNFDKFSANGFEVLLNYIYSGSLAITSDNSDQVLYAANCLQMTNVVETCLNFIRSSFQSSAGKPGQAVVIAGKDMQQHSFPSQDPGLVKAMISNIAAGPQGAAAGNEMDYGNMANIDPTQVAVPAQQVIQPGVALLKQTTSMMNPGAPNKPPPPQYAANKTQPPPTVLQPQVTNIPNGPPPPDMVGPLPQHPLPNPSSEALTRLMPLLIAKNARRPTLGEVHQLLLNGPCDDASNPENVERFMLKPNPPALISATEQNMQFHGHQTQSKHDGKSTRRNSDSTSLYPTPSSDMAPTKPLVSRQSSLVVCSNTNQTTAHTGQTFHLNSAHLTSKDMQPFVVISPNSNAQLHGPIEESGKGRAWSDDRSVGADRGHKPTHLSGTPCADTLTQVMPNSFLPAVAPRSGCMTPSNPTDARFLTSSSPMSFSSSPRIQISPISPADSLAEVFTARSRWSRAQSLDFSQPVQRSLSAVRQTSRSVGSRPLKPGRLFPPIFGGAEGSMTSKLNASFAEDGSESDQSPKDLSSRSRDVSNRISVEEATNAVGALFVATGPEKNEKTGVPDSPSDDSDSPSDDSRLVIAENERSTDQNDRQNRRCGDEEDDDALLLPKEEQDDFDGRFPITDQEATTKSSQARSEQADNAVTTPVPIVKAEETSDKQTKRAVPFGHGSSPRPKMLKVTHGTDERQSDNASASIASSSARDSDSEENFALDLTMPKTSKSTINSMAQQSTDGEAIDPAGDISYRPDYPDSNGISSPTKMDHKRKEALDALVLLQTKMSNINVIPPQSVFNPTTGATDENSLRLGFSRKPRRSSGGQTCQWPGCGRLFRHRNIYEEHQKLHEMGVPVTQLRKCYMGARVKKTARERLEEMRMVDGGAQGTADEQVHENGEPPTLVPPQRAQQGRRKKTTPSRDGPDRKRVTVKDRKDHYLAQMQKTQDSGGVAALSQLQHQQLMGQQLGVPMTVLQSPTNNGIYSTVQQQWQGPVPFVPGGTPASQAFEQNLPRFATPVAAQHNGGPVAIAATLAALGIQFPAKRAAEPPVPAVPSSAQSAMTLDQLRRRIAMRETTGGAMPLPPNYQGIVSQAILSGVQSADPQRQGSVPSQLMSAHRTGNVFDVNGISRAPNNAASIQMVGGILPPAQMPVPNPYQGPSPTGGLGPKCS